MASFKIKKPDNFSFDECRWFLDRNFDDCMHRVEKQTVYKAIENHERPVIFELRDGGDDIQVYISLGDKRDKDAVTDFVKEWFDLDRDIRPFYSLLKKDHELKELHRRYKGLRLVGIPDLFELLCWCIIGQQINLDFAYKVKRALVESYGRSVLHEGRMYWFFPMPAVLASLTPEKLRGLQLTYRKAEYIIGVSKLFAEGLLSKQKLLDLGDEGKMREELMKIRGIGEWTANYTVMKGLGGMNCLPIGDSGINIALNQLKGIPKKQNREMVEEVFSRFEGWKSYLVYYLWRSRRDPL